MRILITGGSGQVGTEALRIAARRGHVATDLSRRSGTDLTDHQLVERAVRRAEPEVILHCAAWTAVDDAEAHEAEATELNGRATANLVRCATEVGAHVVYVSTDYVFDGTKVGAYLEDDIPCPQSAYGRSKLAGELALRPTDAIARTSWMSGAHGPNMVKTILRIVGNPEPLRFVDDQVGRPTFAPDFAEALMDLAEQRAPGIFHVTNLGTVSWFEFAREVLITVGEDPDRVEPIRTSDLRPPRPAPRPANSVLDGPRLAAAGVAPLRDFRPALEELIADLARTQAT
jgi:dTDP-4-dehydrorhamnose reductase